MLTDEVKRIKLKHVTDCMPIIVIIMLSIIT